MHTSIVIVIPVFKSYEQLRASEIASYKQLLKVLGEYTIYLIGPQELPIAGYQDQAASCKVKLFDKRFDNAYFRSTEGYDELLKSVSFYKQFKTFQYLLVYHLDAYVFRDELFEWCNKGYDYIGAPWFENFAEAGKSSNFLGVGNGGFSLRNVQKGYRIARHFERIMKIYKVFCFFKLNRITTFPKFIFWFYRTVKMKKDEQAMNLLIKNYHEDIFWGIFIPRIFNYRVATPEEALKFSFEVNPSLLYEKNNRQLPFGCHAWEKYEPAFWKQFIHIHKKTYDVTRITKSTSMTRTVLFYNRMFDKPLDYPKHEIPEGIIITEDRNVFQYADAVVFHLPSVEPLNNFVKPHNQLWVAWNQECELNIPWHYQPEVREKFDLYMTYRLNSDIPLTYKLYEYKERLRQPISPKSAANPAAMFISSAVFNHHSKRIEYLLELLQYMDIDSYGGILNNRQLSEDKGEETKIKTISNYKFTIAFENAIAEDYVTEKFYQPLIAGSVPVYLGAPNIQEFAPGNNCFINVADFKKPEDLAVYITEIESNEKEYARFFEWRDQPYRPRFTQLIESQKEHWMVRLCRKIEEYT